MGKVVWTDEMKALLVALYQSGNNRVEIAELMGLKVEVVENAIGRAKRGVWGEKYRLERRSALAKANSEALVQGMTYGQLQAKKMCEAQKRTIPTVAPEPVAEVAETTPEPQDLTVMPTNAPIDLVEAIEVLTACAQIFGCDKLLQVRGSATLDKASVTFTHGERECVLSIYGLGAEE